MVEWRRGSGFLGARVSLVRFPTRPAIHPRAEQRPNADEVEQTPRDASRRWPVAGGPLIGSTPGLLAEAGKRQREICSLRAPQDPSAESGGLLHWPLCGDAPFANRVVGSPKRLAVPVARQRLAASRSSSGGSPILAHETASQNEGPGGPWCPQHQAIRLRNPKDQARKCACPCLLGPSRPQGTHGMRGRYGQSRGACANG